MADRITHLPVADDPDIEVDLETGARIRRPLALRLPGGSVIAVGPGITRLGREELDPTSPRLSRVQWVLQSSDEGTLLTAVGRNPTQVVSDGRSEVLLNGRPRAIRPGDRFSVAGISVEVGESPRSAASSA